MDLFDSAHYNEKLNQRPQRKTLVPPAVVKLYKKRLAVDFVNVLALHVSHRTPQKHSKGLV